MIQNIKNFIHENRTSIIICLLYILPIILAGTYYTDDMGRAYRGHGWDGDGRFLANIIINLLSFGNGILSSFPYTTIFSAIIFLFAGISVHQTIFGLDKNIKTLIPLLLVTSPFLLENLSYRYDCLPMALSLLAAVVPYHFVNTNKFIPLSIICVFASLGLYQVSAMIYVSLCICLMIKRTLDGTSLVNITLAAKVLVSFIIGYAIYAFCIKYFNYTVGRTGIIPLDDSFFHVIISRTNKYIDNFTLLYQSGFKFPIFIMMALLSISVISTFLSNGLSHAIPLIICAVLSVCLIITTMLPNLVVTTAYITARTFIGFPILIIAILIYVNESKIPFKEQSIFASAFICILFSFFMCAQFSTAIKQNDKYNEYIANAIGVISGQDDGGGKFVTISGTSRGGRSGVFLYNSVPFLKLIAPQYLTAGWVWGGVSLSRHSNINWLYDWKEALERKCESNVVFNNTDFVIRKANYSSIYIIDFNPESCK